MPEVVTNPFGALLGAANALLANKAVTAMFKIMIPNMSQQMDGQGADTLPSA